MTEILTLVADILKQDGCLVLARVIGGRGSAPRDAGARMIIRRDGRTEGTVGGGLVEAMVMDRAADLLGSRTSAICSMALDGIDTASPEMICGGSLELVCEYIPAEGDAVSTFEALGSGIRAGRKQVLCTEFSREGQDLLMVRRYLLHQAGIHDQEHASSVIMERLDEATASVAGSALLEVDGRTVCIDVVDAPESLYIFGAGHVAREVAALASHVGFRTCVFDDRPEFANEARFPRPLETRVLESFADCFHGLSIDDHSFVVIVTRGHEHDRTVLGQALRTGAGYIGMIGSTRKRNIIYRALLSEGFSEEDLQRVHSPIGIAIESETPEEIAVSIVAELIQERSQKR